MPQVAQQAPTLGKVLVARTDNASVTTTAKTGKDPCVGIFEALAGLLPHHVAGPPKDLRRFNDT